MFHPAELKGGNHHEVELAPRVWNTGVGLEPRQRRRVLVKEHVAIAREARSVGLAMEHPELAPVARRHLHREPAGHKREEIARQGRRLGELDARSSRRCRVPGGAGHFPAVGHHRPFLRNLQRQRITGLEIRLVEQREGEPRPGWHKQGVEKVVGAVQRLVAGDELDGDLVAAGTGGGSGDHEVPVLERERHVDGTDAHTAQVLARLLEVEDDAVRGGQRETHNQPTGDGLPPIRRDAQ